MILIDRFKQLLIRSNKDILVFFAFFISVTLHELMHYIVSLITFGKPVSFSIIPLKEEKGWTLGYVESLNINFINAPLIGLAPLILIFIAYKFYSSFFIYFEFNLINAILFYIILYFLVANSIPSKEDIKVSFHYWYLTIPFYLIVYYSYPFILNFISNLKELL